MNKPLLGQRIAVLVANGFSEKDLTFTQKAMAGTGACVRIVAMDHGLVNSWAGEGWGLNFAADQVLSQALAADYDMLLVPGGRRSIEKLELTAHTRRFIAGFIDTHKPVVFYEDALELLLFSERVKGRTVAGPVCFEARVTEQGGDFSDAPYILSAGVMTGRSDEDTREEYAGAVSQFLTHGTSGDQEEKRGETPEPVAA